jgi:hypothetical protein
VAKRARSAVRNGLETGSIRGTMDALLRFLVYASGARS